MEESMTEGRFSTIAPQDHPMITYVTLPEATANIVQLLDDQRSVRDHRVSQGEEIIISQAGQPIAHISPAQRDQSPRVPGQYAGKLIIPDDFNDPLPDDILDGFLNPAGL
jgi:antitoxin (DNA-binding transcriptional repressor) of toxin-antitoxin stability system